MRALCLIDNTCCSYFKKVVAFSNHVGKPLSGCKVFIQVLLVRPSCGILPLNRPEYKDKRHNIHSFTLNYSTLILCIWISRQLHVLVISLYAYINKLIYQTSESTSHDTCLTNENKHVVNWYKDTGPVTPPSLCLGRETEVILNYPFPLKCPPHLLLCLDPRAVSALCRVNAF